MKRSDCDELLLLVLAAGVVKSFGAVLEIDLFWSFSAVALKLLVVAEAVAVPVAVVDFSLASFFS